MKNNLFSYATSELSQDAFLCWLASFALEDARPDAALQACARELLTVFVPELRGRPFTLTRVERQVMHMDVLLTVSSEGRTYCIVVEDKTGTSEHDDQLARYLRQLREDDPACEARGVYYKTGFQSDWSRVRKAGYEIVTRPRMLELLAAYRDRTDNAIFRDYCQWLEAGHREAMRYVALPLSQWASPQILAFYDDLQAGGFAEARDVWLGYGYVSTPSGGFDGLWTGFRDDRVTILGVPCEVYLQIEPKTDGTGRRFPICLKLSLSPAGEPAASPQQVRDAAVYDGQGRYRLGEFRFRRPARLASGRHMTIGEYDAAPETAGQLRDALSAALADCRQLLDAWRQ